MQLRLNNDEFNAALDALKRDYDVYAPVRFEGQGRVSDTDVIRYAPLARIEDLVHAEKSTFSPKEIVTPLTQTLFNFTGSTVTETPAPPKPAAVFLRACDINGFHRLDKIFMENGGTADFYYERLRRKLKFILLECGESFENCFCVSMDANRTDDYAAAVKCGPSGVMLQVRDTALETYFENTGNPTEYEPAFVEENGKRVNVPDTAKMPADIHDHAMWKEYDTRCIACGRCTTHCVTCSCFSTRDMYYDDNGRSGERRRVWASCHIDGFSTMAGGHDFRKNNGARMRFKTLHKVYDYKKRFKDTHMCVGCGRCDDNCPEYISFAAAVNKLTEVVR